MYLIIRAYKDFTSMTEHTDNIANAFAACAIYLEDSECITVKIVDTQNEKIIADYWAE